MGIQIQECEHETIEYVQIPPAATSDDQNAALKFEFVCQSRGNKKKKNSNQDCVPWLDYPANNDLPTKWVRIDPDYEWLSHFIFFIIDSKISITQLLHDDVRDV